MLLKNFKKSFIKEICLLANLLAIPSKKYSPIRKIRNPRDQGIFNPKFSRGNNRNLKSQQILGYSSIERIKIFQRKSKTRISKVPSNSLEYPKFFQENKL